MKSLLVLSLIFIIVFIPFSLPAQGNPAITISPQLQIPIGMETETNLFLYSTGCSLSAAGVWDFSTHFFGEASIDMLFIPTLSADLLLILAANAGAGLQYSPLPFLTLKARASLGIGLGIFDNQPGFSPYIKAGGDVLFALNPAFDIGLGVSCNSAVGLYNGISINFNSQFKLQINDKAQSEFQVTNLLPVYPVLYKYYENNPFGEAVFQNHEGGSIQKMHVTLFVPGYMNGPKIIGRCESLAKEQQLTIPLQALFMENILQITEAAKIRIDFAVEYYYRGEKREIAFSDSLRIQDRNALTWEDNKRIAAFISPRNPQVIFFAKKIAALIRKEGCNAVNTNFCLAVGILESLAAYGIYYVTDPRTPYAELSANTAAVDYLQFPAQTIQYKAGDCDDLTILFCSLFESIGIPTAIITIPGHIYMAVDLQMLSGEAIKLFSFPQDLIFRDNTTWLPVEVTSLHKGFSAAWKTGAKEWRSNAGEGKACFYKVSEAWTTYEPVGFINQEFVMTEMSDSGLIRQYTSSLDELVNNELSCQRKRQWNKYNSDIKVFHNKMGILCARFGDYNTAEVEFQKALQLNHLPAYVNLANLYYLQQNWDKAIACFTEAVNREPGLISALVGLAVCYYEKDDRAQALDYYNQIKAINQELAAQYAYLVAEQTDTGCKASAPEKKEVIVWEEK